jgi:hypothetical protein
MMDDNLSALNSLPYSLPKLKEDLAADKRTLRVALQIEAKKYPPHIERRLTSSDLGVIVDYRDNFNSANSFQKAALFQAKKLYGGNKHHNGRYSVNDCFDELDPEQLRRMADMAGNGEFNKDQLHPQHSDGVLFHYLFYCPRVGAYDERSQEELWHHVIPSGQKLFHFWHHHPFWFEEGPLHLAEAHHLHEYASDTDRHFRMSRLKLVYSAGVSPARATVRGPVAWIVRRKETESRKSIDKAILGMVSESSGRNESERTGGPENVNPRGRALGNGVKAAWNVAIWPKRRDTLAG